MGHRTNSLIVAVLFSVVAVMHACRLLFGWQVTIASWIVPLWVSWVAIVVTAYLAYQSFKHARSK